MGKNHIRTKGFFAVLLLAAAVSVSVVPFPASAQDVFTGNPVARIVRQSAPAVVNIDTEAMVQQSMSPFPNDPVFRELFGDRFSREVPMRGKGSGFIVTGDGYILTNNHVIDGPDNIKIEVTLSDGKIFPAEVVGKDPTFDLAVIKIESKGLPTLPLGDSDSVEVGEWAIAIGNPFGFESSVTVGVISAKNRSVRARDLNFDGFLQTDAAINPGNSGGPLLNLQGEVVGINTAIIPYAQGIGFAVPVNMAKQIMDDLVNYGKVNRGWLGIYLQPLSREFASAYGIETDSGAVVSDVVKGSPAEKAGIARGDVIIEMNGRKILDHRDVIVGVRQQLAGQKIDVLILRRGSEKKITVTLGNVPSVSVAGRSPSEPAPKVATRLGITVSPVTDETREEYGFSSDSGVVVTEVQPGSVGNRLGLGRGDVILEINGQIVSDTAKWEEILSKGPRNVVFLVLREGRTFFVSANL
jgi:serine protease Do